MGSFNFLYQLSWFLLIGNKWIVITSFRYIGISFIRKWFQDDNLLNMLHITFFWMLVWFLLSSCLVRILRTYEYFFWFITGLHLQYLRFHRYCQFNSSPLSSTVLNFIVSLFAFLPLFGIKLSLNVWVLFGQCLNIDLHWYSGQLNSSKN